MLPKDQILARMYVVLTLLGLVPMAVGVRVAWIVVTEGGELAATAERQARSVVEVPAMRGALLDRAGRALAVNTARYDVALDPTVGDPSPEADTLFFDTLARVTGRPAAALRRRVGERSSPQYVRLARGLTDADRDALEAVALPGLIVTPRFARRYHHGAVASHVLGHVSADGHGLAGLEMQYDAHLHGTPGRRAVQRDRRGHIKAFVGGRVVEPRHGHDLVLTLDLVRQALLEEELARGVRASEAASGTAIAMNPHTGAILAMASVPTYDPNRPAAYRQAARRNRAITDQFEPGSTFKLVAAAAALERGRVSLTDSVETGAGWAVFAGYTMRDVHAYGTITFADVLVKSSNVGVAKTVAKHLDPGTFYQYARNLGFGQPTYIDLPGEASGVLKNPTDWSRTSLTSMSIGYEVAATPLQVLTAYAALANGGLLVRPHLVAERRTFDGQRVWSYAPDSVRRAVRPSTARRLRAVFERVVEEGTATRARIPGLRIAGKTGTALKASSGGYDRSSSRASFVGFFPADDPAVAVIVVINEPKTSLYGGAVAAPVFERVARRWASSFPRVMDRLVAVADTLHPARSSDLPAPPAPPTHAPAPRTDTPPRTDTTLRTATEAAARADARTAERGDGARVMPDLTGLSTRDAVRWLYAQGVVPRVHGTGRVARHTPAPGEALAGSATLRCTEE